MEDTVFSPSFGNRPSQLVGRQEVIKRFRAGLQSKTGNRDRAVLLLGQRGSGKTVLLWEFADIARKAGFVVANPTTASEDMLARIVEKLQDDGESLKKPQKPKMNGGSVGALGFSVGLQFTREVQETKSFQYKLTHLCRKLTADGHGVLVLIDEVQANTPDMRQVIAAYQEIVGEGLDIAIAMAGLPGAVSSTLNDKVLTFLNRARRVELKPLPASEVDAFYATAFHELGLRISDNLRRRAAAASHGSPYMLQLVGHYLVAYAGDSDEVNETTLAHALESAQIDFEDNVCRTTVAALSDKDLAFLAAMAQDDGESLISDVAQRMGVTNGYAQQYRRRLRDAGIIEATRRAHIAFAVPHLADYLRREQFA